MKSSSRYDSNRWFLFERCLLVNHSFDFTVNFFFCSNPVKRITPFNLSPVTEVFFKFTFSPQRRLLIFSSHDVSSFVLQMSYKAVEFAVEQSLSDLLFHVDSQERPVQLPEKTLVPPKRKWGDNMQFGRKCFPNILVHRHSYWRRQQLSPVCTPLRRSSRSLIQILETRRLRQLYSRIHSVGSRKLF